MKELHLLKYIVSRLIVAFCAKWENCSLGLYLLRNDNKENYKEGKMIYGMYRSKSKGSAFRVMKPCIEFMHGFFFCINQIEDTRRIDYNI